MLVMDTTVSAKTRMNVETLDLKRYPLNIVGKTRIAGTHIDPLDVTVTLDMKTSKRILVVLI